MLLNDKWLVAIGRRLFLKGNIMILDRSTIERIATCPQQGYLAILRDILIAQIKGQKLETWELKLLEAASTELIELLKLTILQAETDEIREIGHEVHRVTEAAFKACDNDLDIVADWLVDNLPDCRPDIQPKVIRAARYICDMICNLKVSVLAAEKQFDCLLVPAVGDRDKVIATICLDLICQGLSQSIHVFDWKSGYKRYTNSETVDSFQAQFGAWMLFSQPEYAHVETIHWWYYETRFGTKAYARFDRNNEHPRLPHLTTFVGIDRRVRTAVKLFLDGNRECWPTEKKCCWCPVVRWCKLAHISAADIASDPTVYIDKLIVDAQIVANRKKAATAWIKAKGPIEGTKVVYDKKSPSNRFTAEFREKAECGGNTKKVSYPKKPVTNIFEGLE